MPTATEVTMAKMIVSGLPLHRKEGLLDLLCEDDPSKVLHLLQLETHRQKQGTEVVKSAGGTLGDEQNASRDDTEVPRTARCSARTSTVGE
jgi:hypothetical protein